MKLRRFGSLLLLAGFACGAVAQEAASKVFVNGAALPVQTVRALEQAYGVPIAAGRYWYDPVSGAWDAEGGPIG